MLRESAMAKRSKSVTLAWPLARGVIQGRSASPAARTGSSHLLYWLHTSVVSCSQRVLSKASTDRVRRKHLRYHWGDVEAVEQCTLQSVTFMDKLQAKAAELEGRLEEARRREASASSRGSGRSDEVAHEKYLIALAGLKKEVLAGVAAAKASAEAAIVSSAAKRWGRIATGDST